MSGYTRTTGVGEGAGDRTGTGGGGLDDRTGTGGEGLEDRTETGGGGLDVKRGKKQQTLDDRTEVKEGPHFCTNSTGGALDYETQRREEQAGGLDYRTNRGGIGLDGKTAEWQAAPGGHGWVGVGVGVGGVGELMVEKLSVTGLPLPPLPPNTKPLSHQVAGHVYGKSSSRLGMLECGDGTILKPLPEGCCGQRELAFYERVWHSRTPNTLHQHHHQPLQPPVPHTTNFTTPNGLIPNTRRVDCAEDGFDLIPLDDEHGENGGPWQQEKGVREEGVRQGVSMQKDDGEEVQEVLCKAQKLTPVYLGTYIDPATPEVQYLLLGDLTYGFHRPCIADIKIGRRSYDPEATPDKITKELHKYPPQQKFCFQLKGMRSYCRKLDQFTTCSKEYLRCLDEEGVQREGFARFFNNGFGLREDVVNSCIKKLEPIIEWTKQQRLFAFYASSILVIYGGTCDKYDCFGIKDNVQKKSSGSPFKDTQDISEHNVEGDSKGAASVRSTALSCEASKHPNRVGASSKASRRGNQFSSIEGGYHQINLDVLEQQPEKPPSVGKEETGRTEHSAGPVDKSKGCSCKQVEVKMIDFARVFPMDKFDTNYLEGLISLMGHFEQLLQAEQ